MLDLVLTGMKEGRYKASIRASGDISHGKEKMGAIFSGFEGNMSGELGEVIVDAEGRGHLVREISWRVWELVGRGVVVESCHPVTEVLSEKGANEVLGVIARSAGLWENEKTVCSCTGKTVWEEREQMARKGIT